MKVNDIKELAEFMGTREHTCTRFLLTKDETPEWIAAKYGDAIETARFLRDYRDKAEADGVGVCEKAADALAKDMLAATRNDSKAAREELRTLEANTRTGEGTAADHVAYMYAMARTKIPDGGK
ncbi:hypothetical protein BN2475_1110001 [Paraburkholderia ribeironis]|uniref:Uncharacterized protein n=1 Tax=Paraburkholderia ribeironis TaxID=1247936 RepID=A0A1N7SMS4_9BURK|nr:hypothetical protein BN2475_1110001 [Paraburkholderia ribeironis]